MKNLIILICITGTNILYAQELPRDSVGKVAFIKVVEVSGVNKSELFSRCIEWASKSIVTESDLSQKNVVQYEDKEKGLIVCKGNINSTAYNHLGMPFVSAWINFVVTINVKDEKARYIFSNFEFNCIPTKGSQLPNHSDFDKGEEDFRPKKNYYKGIEEINEMMIVINKSFLEAVKKPAIGDGW